MTAGNGIPASEAAELEGLRYDAAAARKEFGDTVHILAGRLVHHPTAGQLAMRLAGNAVRRMTAPTRRAIRDQLTGNRILAARSGHTWASAAAVAGAALAIGALAVATLRHRQRGNG